jgi:peroxiredoxin
MLDGETLDALNAFAVDELLIYCVNDGVVMKAWAEDQGVPEDGLISLMGEVKDTLDMELTHAGPKSVGLINRCKRFTLYVIDDTVKIARVAESDDDPAGDDFPDVTLAEATIDAIKA